MNRTRAQSSLLAKHFLLQQPDANYHLTAARQGMADWKLENQINTSLKWCIALTQSADPEVQELQSSEAQTRSAVDLC